MESISGPAGDSNPPQAIGIDWKHVRPGMAERTQVHHLRPSG